MRVLYLSYDGALDPLGRAQVVPYLEGLVERGHDFDLLTYEKPDRLADAGARRAMEERLEARGIRWHRLRYRKRPPVLATALDLWTGAGRVRRIAADRKIELVHARSYPSTLMAWRLRRRRGVPYLFDMRGLYAEERVEGGLWRRGGVVYRVTKALERRFLRDAAGVVTLTVASRPRVREMMDDAGSRAALRVIPTCVDLERFRARPTLPPDAPFVLTYLGSVGTWYLLEEMLHFGREVLERAGAGARLRFVVNQGRDRVRAEAARAGIASADLEVRSVLYPKVPEVLAASHATFFLIRPYGSKVASAATKFGESLAVGRPVAANPGVGDSARIIRDEGVGVVVEELEPVAYARAADELVRLARDPKVAGRCRETAERHYSLAGGVAAYDELYGEIAGGGGSGPAGAEGGGSPGAAPRRDDPAGGAEAGGTP